MVRLKSCREIDIMRRGGVILAEALRIAETSTRAGMTTAELDEEIEAYILSKGGEPAFKGYRGFPNCCCISINEELVHGIPGKRVIRDGDIVSVDAGVKLEGYYSDAAITVAVGESCEETRRLLQTTRTSLEKAIESLRAGVRLSEIARAVQEYVEANGFSVVRAFVGHGIGRKLWEDPHVPNFWDEGVSNAVDAKLAAGTVIAIEPMVNVGHYEVKTLSDNWTVVTSDGKRCAHYEHTVAITETGSEVLTRA